MNKLFEEIDEQGAINWLKQIKDKYIHGGDEFFDSMRKVAIDRAIKSLEKEIELKKLLKDYD